MFTFYEFFAGGGMARAGLGENWTCLFANDFDHKKGRTYADNWGELGLKVADIGSVSTKDLPGRADLAWASFPCQDLSLAGAGAGLRGERSGTFWPFWRLMKAIKEEGRPPRIIILENVCGMLTSHGGKDFGAICDSLREIGYHFGAVVVDAAMFTPQSRPRLIIIAVRDAHLLPPNVQRCFPSESWHTQTLVRAYKSLSELSQTRWIWWDLPRPIARVQTLADIVDNSADTPEWFTPEQVKSLLSMMSSVNRAKVTKAMRYGRRIVGSVYKRTRICKDGKKLQRAEVRFDGLSGCLRTPAGGSSRQVLLVIDGNSVRARLISIRETARLMGLSEEYQLPKNYNEGYHLTGDGVAVPVVSFIARHLVEPILVKASENDCVAA